MKPPAFRKYALMPAMYASTSFSSCRPFAVFAASFDCVARNASVYALGTKVRAERATENAS